MSRMRQREGKPVLHTTADMRFRRDKPAFTQIALCHGFCKSKNTCQSASPTVQLLISANVVRNATNKR